MLEVDDVEEEDEEQRLGVRESEGGDLSGVAVAMVMTPPAM